MGQWIGRRQLMGESNTLRMQATNDLSARVLKIIQIDPKKEMFILIKTHVASAKYSDHCTSYHSYRYSVLTPTLKPVLSTTEKHFFNRVYFYL